MTLDEMISEEQELRAKIAKLAKKADKLRDTIKEKIAPYVIEKTIERVVERDRYVPYPTYPIYSKLIERIEYWCSTNSVELKSGADANTLCSMTI